MRVIYWCPARDVPTGGVRVIYRHCDGLNELGAESLVFHWDNPAFSCSWFQHSTKLLQAGDIDPASDFSLVPEYLSAPLGNHLRQSGARYGIFVQNGSHVLWPGAGQPPRLLIEAYEHAEVVVTISDHTTAFVRFLFPDMNPDKVVQVVPAVEGRLEADKAKVISWMPRKLQDHAAAIEQMGRHLLPTDWTLTPLDGLSQERVYDHLAKSSIFISLSNLEGLGLPPIEAALSGNVVVGYPGIGGDEYFQGPLFTKVEHGDFLALFREVRRLTVECEKGLLRSAAVQQSIRDLATRYSTGSEMTSLGALKARIERLW